MPQGSYRRAGETVFFREFRDRARGNSFKLRGETRREKEIFYLQGSEALPREVWVPHPWKCPEPQLDHDTVSWWGAEV